MTQDEVGRHLDLARSAIAQIEAGNRSVSSLELDRLALLFGRDIREFVADAFREEDPLSALFRAQPGVMEQPGILDHLRRCLMVGRELTNLERLLGIDRELTPVASFPLPSPRTRWEAIQQGEALAAHERRRLALAERPLPDIAGLLDAQGVRTSEIDLPEDISGVTLSDGGASLFVVVNRRHPRLRRRFSWAHEYAHVAADRAYLGMVSRTCSGDDLWEVRANAFAAAFLLPEGGLQQRIARLGKGKPSRFYAEVFDGSRSVSVEGRTEPGSQSIQLHEVVQLAHEFDVSRAAALYRLRNLRLVTAQELARLKAEDEAGRGKKMAALFGFPDAERGSARSELPSRSLGLALEAYRRSIISRGKLREIAELFGMSRKDLEELLALAGLDDENGRYRSVALLQGGNP